MSPQDFLANFHEIANAPGGVGRLRDVVLQLAVTGHLVGKDESRGTAGNLSHRIHDARFAFAKSEGTKLATATATTAPAELEAVPSHWLWCKLGDLTTKIGSGSTPSGGSKVYVSKGIPFLRSQNIWNEGLRMDDVVYIPDDVHASMKGTYVQPNDILLNITGASLGRCALVPEDLGPANVSQHVTIIRCALPDIRQFVRLCLLSPFGQAMIWGRQVGMAREGLSKKVLEQFEIPLPPLAEQKRIVAKVDELIALCDALEAQQQERDRLFPQLSRATHIRLTNSPSHAHLDALFTDLGTVSPQDVRRSIVSLALRGLLSDRVETNETGEKLFLEVQAERQRLGRCSGSTNAPPGDLGLFAVPDTWTWTKFDDLLIDGPTNGTSPKSPKHETQTRSLTLSATTSGRFKPEHFKYIDLDLAEDSELWLNDGDLLVQRGNSLEYVGVAAVYHGEPNQFVYPDLMMRCRVSQLLDVDFIHLAMNGEESREFLRARASGTSGSMPKINQGTLRSLPVPLPPLAEQRRIVAMVEELMALVDALEARQKEKSRLAEAFAQACVASITGTRIETRERMKAPKTELISMVALGPKKPAANQAPLATILAENNGELSAKSLWQRSGLGIDEFYQQLKNEIVEDWIAIPSPATVMEVSPPTGKGSKLDAYFDGNTGPSSGTKSRKRATNQD